MAEVHSRGRPEPPSRGPFATAARAFRRDRTGMAALVVVLLCGLLALAAPLLAAAYGKNPTTHYGQDVPGLLSAEGLPVLPNGGISAEHWFGIEPGLGRDVLTQLLYGMRTSLLVALASVAVIAVVGVVLGVTVGYLSGLADRAFAFVCNVLLAFPTLLLLLALSPVIQTRFVDPGENEPAWMQFTSLILVFAAFGWVPLAMVLRTAVRSLREREFIEAARALGASRRHIVLRELLPNVWAPVLVHITLAVPGIVTAEAALSFLGVGINEPVPDWGRMISRGSEVFYDDPTYMVFPGVAILVFVLAFNLLGDAVRDALDPRTAA
ncbi:ABC transporter permease [Streptomyces eurocidicus]|uniref:ABC transporter permease n=1 Tax=Streptomyces eurocidicus TaxID=66423 RepID=A0A2N8NML2_STREU|nr:ABC transporter permease [Streptomyces eurocidicus]MBB5120722.1 peptide/nickel transport system permease protein [Streptomyces eurocidicus]MBF6050357.1 ABC transporter permease subunit [Streptomyces eurocidicus]PNE30004.1 ABC transporter permease [Streptomyces eurocidicus]